MKEYHVSDHALAIMAMRSREAQYEIARRANETVGFDGPRLRGAMDYWGGVSVHNKDIVIHETIVKDVENKLVEQTDEEVAVAKAIEELGGILDANSGYLDAVSSDIHGDPLRAMLNRFNSDDGD